MSALIAVVDNGGFAAASRQTGRAQPWLSVQVRQIEEEIGFHLLNRSAAGRITLTDDGKQFLPLARSVLEAHESMINASRRIARFHTKTLELGADPFTLHMPERNALIAQFMKTYGEVELNIVSAPPVALYQRLLRHELDVVIASEPAPDAVETVPLCRYSLALLIPREHPLAMQETVDLSQLAGQSLLTVERDYHPLLLAQLADFLDARGVALAAAPEPGYGPVIRFAQMQRRVMATVDFPSAFHEVPADMVYRPTTPPRFVTQFSLARVIHGPRTQTAERFWRLALLQQDATGLNQAPSHS